MTSTLSQALEQIETRLSDPAGQRLETITAAIAELQQLEPTADHPEHRAWLRSLAGARLSETSALVQNGQPAQAVAAGSAAVQAARASGDPLTLARCMLAYGSALLLENQFEAGLGFLDMARMLFERGDTPDHLAGLGWYYLLKADLGVTGLVTLSPVEILRAAEEALSRLLLLEDYAGAARACAARAYAFDLLEDAEAAAEERQQQAAYEKMIPA